MDNLSKDQRHKNMVAIKSKDTKPELIVRTICHKLGFRFRLHRKDILGKPDLVFVRLKKIIFVHGCFWHRHSCRRGQVFPKTNKVYWNEKISRNVKRDEHNLKRLRNQKWKILVIWECQTKNLEKLRGRIGKFLSK